MGVGAGVQSGRAHFPPASGSGRLSKTPSSCLGFIRRCRHALYSDTTTQGKNRGRQKQDGMSGALGDPLLQVAGLFHQRPTLHSKKVPFLTLNKSPNLSFVNKTEILPPTPCDCNTEIKCSKCLTNYSFCN